jgi:hypothetical protein
LGIVGFGQARIQKTLNLVEICLPEDKWRDAIPRQCL